MLKLNSRVSGLASVAVLLSAAGLAQFAEAVTIDFENPPYAVGPAVGQDDWIDNSYIAGGNGSEDVSTAAPLSGAQSLLYTQSGTSSLFNDISNAGVINVVSDGTQAIDFTASVLMSADIDSQSLANGQLGMFLGPDGFNGASRIGVLLNNANSSGGTGQIEVLESLGFINEVAYTAGNTIEFQIGVNLDSTQNFTVAYRDVTAAGPWTQLPGTSGGRYGLFPADGWPDNGTPNNYTVDVGLFLRGGTGQIDDITLLVPEPTSSSMVLASVVLALVRRSKCVTCVS